MMLILIQFAIFQVATGWCRPGCPSTLFLISPTALYPPILPEAALDSRKHSHHSRALTLCVLSAVEALRELVDQARGGAAPPPAQRQGARAARVVAWRCSSTPPTTTKPNHFKTALMAQGLDGQLFRRAQQSTCAPHMFFLCDGVP